MSRKIFLFVFFTFISAAVVLADVNVKDFGAVGDGAVDSTAAFQKALDAAAGESQVVFVPRGKYRFDGSLNIPQGVTLKGVWESVPSHVGIRNNGQVKPTDDGTTLLVYGGKGGNEEAKPFITLNTNSTLKGVCVYYPEQNEDDIPIEYAWTIAMRGKNPAVLECELLNPYRAIDASQNERHLIRNVSGQPLRLGVFVDSIYDVGRIENVHFNPWWSMKPKLFRWQMENGVAFVFARTDWQYVHNTFVFGYKVGYHFAESKSGACNGNFLGIGADDCTTAVQVDNSAPFGILITNGEFVSFHGQEPTMVRVGEKNRGAIRFVNCAFWGPCYQNANIYGRGTVGFSDCTFVQWGFKQREGGGRRNEHEILRNVPAIQANGGNLLVRGCEFMESKPQILIGEKIRKAVVTDNIINGKEQIENKAGEKPSVVIKNNATE